MKKPVNKKKMLRKKLLIATAPGKSPEPTVYAAALSYCQQLASNGNYPMTAFIAEQIAVAMPEALDPQLLLLSARINLMKMDQAEQLATHLLQQFPRSEQVYKTVADYHIAVGNPEVAMPLLQEAIKLKPKQATHYNAIAHLHLIRGESQQALTALNRAIALQPAYAGAHWNRAQLLKHRSGPETIKQLETLASSGKLGGRPLAMVYFSLAWCYDETEKERHFYHLDQANALMAKVLNANIDAEIATLGSSLQFDGRRLAQTLADKGIVDEAPIFICSMPRSGTTLLEQILGAHSKAYPVGETGALMSATTTVGSQLGKPGPFWQWANEETLSRCLPRIDKLFRSSPFLKSAAGRRVIDKSINNIVVAGLIPLIYPNARIIHLTRNPMAVALSCYQLYFEYGQSYTYNLRDIARAHRLYGDIMNHWKEQFPDNIIQVSYESLVTEPEAEARRCLSFCDLPWEDSCLRYHEAHQTIRTASYMQASKPISTASIDRWKTYESHLHPVAEELGLS